MGWWIQYKHDPEMAVHAKVEQAFVQLGKNNWYAGVVMSQKEDGTMEIKFNADGDLLPCGYCKGDVAG